jgi:hypothetical protein
VTTNRNIVRRRRRDELSHDQMLELWLGPDEQRGSLFNDREELQSAWDTHRDVLMERWGSHGRRPQIWWELATEMQFPGLDREKSTLWRAGVLAPAERAELEAEWLAAFQHAQSPKFSYQLEPGRFVGGEEGRKLHYRAHDIPYELVRRWTVEHRQRRKKEELRATAVTAQSSDQSA